jgi:tetratricopeptide (TPR) repeat protein/tRNA A-37 threonylcarbamoyl transferase component Bud32
MTTAKVCSQCRAELAADAPEGLCPRCLLCGGVPTTDAAPVPAPTPAELAALFPQLEIVELLGQGGMGTVYKARQTKLDRPVALKILALSAERGPDFAERFNREARALARLNHPNIVSVFDFGEVNGLYYLLMEYVDGVDLRRTLEKGPLAPRHALALVGQICTALQYAHDRGVVHRDVKPENILLDRDGNVKIADFGLAKLVGRSQADQRLTATRQIMGTPHYMAPEQIERPLDVDHRADIYSLGVVFYEMLTHELPLGKFEPPSHKAAVDVRLDEVVLRAMEREPGRRYQRMTDIRLDLEHLAGPEVAAVVAAGSRLSVKAWTWLGIAAGLVGLAVFVWLTQDFITLKHWKNLCSGMWWFVLITVFVYGFSSEPEKKFDVLRRVCGSISALVLFSDIALEWLSTGQMSGNFWHYILLCWMLWITFSDRTAEGDDEGATRDTVAQDGKEEESADEAQRRKRWQEVLSQADETLREDPDCVSEDDFTERVAELSKAIEQDHRCIALYRKRAACYQRLGKLDDAVGDFSRMLMLSPHDLPALAARGKYLCERGRYAEALVDLNQAADKDPLVEKVLACRAECHYHLGDYPAAIADFDRAILMEPANAVLYEQRGRCHQNLKEYRKALVDFDAVLRLAPQHAAAQAARGECQRALDKAE